MKLPVGYFKPAILDKDKQVEVDYPISTWIPGWDENRVSTQETRYKNSIEQTFDPESKRTLNDICNEDELKFFRKLLQGEADFLLSKGPGFKRMNTKLFQENLDWRPWYELEKEYGRFLVINQYCWVEHILNYWPKITEEGIERAGCKKLLECLRNGRAKLIITIPWESGWWADWNYVEWKPALDRLGIPTENVILLCPQSKNIKEFGMEKYGIRFETFENFERYPWDLSGEMNRIKQELKIAKQQFLEFNHSRSETAFKFFCHIGNLQDYRLGLYTILHNFLNPQETLVNMSMMAYQDSDLIRQEYGKCIGEVDRCKAKGRLKPEEYDAFRKVLCFNRDIGHIRFVSEPELNDSVPYVGDWDYNHVLLDSWRKQGLIEVFGETRCLNRTSLEEDRDGNHCWFITEKTTKPFISLKPFLCLANQGYLKYLQSQGYKTFSRWWDESYDDEPNWVDRELKVLRVLKELEAKPLGEIYDMLEDMEETLIHNFNLRASKIINRDFDFLTLLQSFLYEDTNRILFRGVKTATPQLV